MNDYTKARAILGSGYCTERCDGSLVVAVEDPDCGSERSAAEALDDALGKGTSTALLEAGYDVEWTGDGNTDADGVSTSDIQITRDEAT